MSRAPGGGLGWFFQAVMAVYEYNTKKMQAGAAMSRASMWADYQYRLDEFEKKKAEAQIELANAEAKTITAQTAALKKIEALEQEQKQLLEAVELKALAHVVLVGAGVTAAAVAVWYLVKHKSDK